jgi:hypothetical protein
MAHRIAMKSSDFCEVPKAEKLTQAANALD